jgi:hypothetical protein
MIIDRDIILYYLGIDPFFTRLQLHNCSEANVSYLFKGWRYVFAMDPNIGNISMSLIKTDQVNNNIAEKIFKIRPFYTL